MINENEIRQPELNMVSEEPTAPVAEPQTEPATEVPTEAPAESTSEVTASETTATESSAPKAEESVGTYPANVDTNTENQVEKQLAASQQRITELEQHRMFSQAQQEATQYQQSLIQKGYNAEQAQSAAQQWLGTRQQQLQTDQQYKQQIEFKEGQYKASLHYGKQYNVDPEVLLKYQTPQEMEQVARHQSEVRSLKEENARLKKGQVPAQSFDNSTAPANASSSEERLLDLYNQGVRNPETDAAARRAAGIG